MFFKGVMKDNGVDVTIKNNPGHILSPDDWSMVMDVKFGKISPEDYKTYYLELLRKRWTTRKEEFIELAKEGAVKDIKLKCFCNKHDTYCHAYLASRFMNSLVERLRQAGEV